MIVESTLDVKSASPSTSGAVVHCHHPRPSKRTSRGTGSILTRSEEACDFDGDELQEMEIEFECEFEFVNLNLEIGLEMKIEEENNCNSQSCATPNCPIACKRYAQ